MSLLKVLCIFLFTLVYLDIHIASAGESQSVNNDGKKSKSQGNMDKALGDKKKEKSKKNKAHYAWETSMNKNTKHHYSKDMERHIHKSEEMFRDDYYEDYDFEFAKGMVRNDNFETKWLNDQQKRLENGE